MKKLADGWHEVTIEEIASVDSGQGAPQGDKWYNGEKIFIKAGDLNNLTEGKYVGDYCQRIRNEAIGYHKLKEYPANSIVFPKSGMSVKTDNIALLKYDSYVVNHLAIVKVKENLCSEKYLYYLFKWKKISNLSLNDSYPSIRLQDIKNFKILLPPLPTQKKIAAVLEKAEKLREWRKEADGLTDRFLKSTFLEMFGDPVENPKGWEFVQLKSVYSKLKSGTKCGPFGSALKKDEYVNSGVPVWTMDNIYENKFLDEIYLYITNEKYKQLESYSVEKGDILISRAGTVGKMCVANPSINPSVISTNLIRLSLDSSKIKPIFFTCLMTYCKGKIGRLEAGEDGAYTFMNTGILNELQIPLPPLHLQQKFASIVQQVEQIREHQTQSRQHIENFFNVLMQRAFRGELEAK